MSGSSSSQTQNEKKRKEKNSHHTHTQINTISSILPPHYTVHIYIATSSSRMQIEKMKKSIAPY